SFANNGPVKEGENATVTLAGSDPSSVDAASLKYRFDFDNDGTFDQAFDTNGDGIADAVLGASGTVVIPASYLRQSGQVAVHGQAIDTDGASTDAFTFITVQEVAPELTVQGASEVDEGASYTLALSATDPGTDLIRTWSVDWGDGTIEHFTVDPQNGNLSVVH